MKIICITGKAQNGKSTAADILKELYESAELSTVMINYADYVKFVAYKHFNWNGEKDERGRSILQHVGTDLARQVNPDFWVNIVEMTVNTLFADADRIIIADCRFPNELEYWIRNEYNMTSLKIVRTGDFNDGMTEEQRNHPSETALDDYPVDIIVEAQDLEGLRESLEELVERKMV